MGVPQMFKNIIQNYPQVLTPVVPDTHVTRFCVDLNGALHNFCGKVLAKYSGKPLPESEELHQQIADVTLAYMDHCIKLLDPDDVFIGLDGVAPFAKINTQRHRRFRTAKAARLKAEWAADLGIPDQNNRFDTNAISRPELSVSKVGFTCRLQEDDFHLALI
jgi:5'-3' exonuclease